MSKDLTLMDMNQSPETMKLKEIGGSQDLRGNLPKLDRQNQHI